MSDEVEYTVGKPTVLNQCSTSTLRTNLNKCKRILTTKARSPPSYTKNYNMITKFLVILSDFVA